LEPCLLPSYATVRYLCSSNLGSLYFGPKTIFSPGRHLSKIRQFMHPFAFIWHLKRTCIFLFLSFFLPFLYFFYRILYFIIGHHFFPPNSHCQISSRKGVGANIYISGILLYLLPFCDSVC
jgi:hypothetical protein